MSNPDLVAEENSFISALRALGGRASRVDMLAALRGWDEDVFDAVRRRLKQKDIVRIFRGPGGYTELTGHQGHQTREEEFLRKLMDRGAASNRELQEILRWNDAEYQATKMRLLEREMIWVGPGRGGTLGVYEDVEEDLTESKNDDVESEQVAGLGATRKQKERSLYAPILSFIRRAENWDIIFGSVDGTYLNGDGAPGFWAEDTSNKGRGRGAIGKWTCPDISVVSIHSSRFFPVPMLDLYTFEVKSSDNLDVVGVHEAAAQGRRSNLAFAIYQLAKEEQDDKDKARVQPLVDTAIQLGVGLLTVVGEGKGIEDRQHWNCRVKPVRRELSPWVASHFIGKYMSKPTQDEIAKKAESYRRAL